jgi:hypothetical protein
MTRGVAKLVGWAEERPWFAALLLGTVLCLIHLFNVCIYRSVHLASPYLVGYVVARDALLDINNSEWFASSAFVFIVSLFLSLIVWVPRKVRTFVLMIFFTLVVIFVLFSIPLFPDSAFYK